MTVADASHLTANVTIASDAGLGSRDVSFTTGGELAVKLNGFTVTQGPQLVSISPNRGQPGQSNLSVAIVGVFTNFVQGQTSASFGAGITTVSTTVTDATHAVAFAACPQCAGVWFDREALEHGLVLLSCGTNFNVIRILVPLTASDAVLDEGLAMLEESLKLAA